MEPGTEIASVESGLVARIPASNTVVGFQTISKGSILIDIGDVAAPVILQIETTPGELRALDAQGQPLAIVEVSPGMFQVSQPS